MAPNADDVPQLLGRYRPIPPINGEALLLPLGKWIE
jgi:hypothetical protein